MLTAGLGPELTAAVDVAFKVRVFAELMPNAESATMKYVGIVAVCVTWMTLFPAGTVPQVTATMGPGLTHFNVGVVVTVGKFGVLLVPTTLQLAGFLADVSVFEL